MLGGHGVGCGVVCLADGMVLLGAVVFLVLKMLPAGTKTIDGAGSGQGLGAGGQGLGSGTGAGAGVGVQRLDGVIGDDVRAPYM